VLVWATRLSVVAIDWSGRASGERRHLWTAEAHDGELLRLVAGRTRRDVIDELVARVDETPGVVVGFDFSFSLPEWFLRDRGYANPRALWDAAATTGEAWFARLRGLRSGVVPVGPGPTCLCTSAGPRRSSPRSAGSGPSRRFRSAAQEAWARARCAASRPWRVCRTPGFAIWPFDAPARPPVAIEIWPRTFTGPVVKSDAAARATHLDLHLPELAPDLRDAAVGSEDAFDAAVSAVVMSRDEAVLANAACTRRRPRGGLCLGSGASGSERRWEISRVTGRRGAG